MSFHPLASRSKKSARWSHPGLVVDIKNGFEWDDVIREAWQHVEKQNPHFLTDNALKLWIWAKSGKNIGAEISPKSLAGQAHLRGYGCQGEIENLLREIRRKAEQCIRFKNNNDRYKIWFAEEEEKISRVENPSLNIEIEDFQFSDLEAFRVWLYGRIKAMEFKQPDEMFYIYKIGDRKTFKRCFPKFPTTRCPEYVFDPFLNGLDLLDGIQLTVSFETGEPWIIACLLEEEWTWGEIKAAIHEKEREVPLEKKYDLSPDAAALLKWVLALKKSDFIGKLTPVIEDVYKTKIGIITEWVEGNISAYVQMLLDEINQNTEFALKIQPWKTYSKDVTRISVDKKTPEIDQVVRQIQFMGLKGGKIIDPVGIKKWLQKQIF